jgi:hypothetical protein
MDEVGGELRWDLGADYTGELGLRRALDPLSAVRIELGESPSTPSAEAQMAVLLREGDAEPGLYLLWFNGQLQLRVQEQTIATMPEAAWVEVRFVDELMSVSVSDDGETFDEVVTEDAPFDSTALTLWLYGQTWTDAPAPSVASLASVRTCDADAPEG